MAFGHTLLGSPKYFLFLGSVTDGVQSVNIIITSLVLLLFPMVGCKSLLMVVITIFVRRVQQVI